MRLAAFAAVGLFLLGGSSALIAEEPTDKKAAAPIAYPPTKRVDHVDEYHGQKVADPYRWLEDVNSEETKAWVAAQNKVTRAYLDASPVREPIRQRLTELWNYERFTPPLKRGGRYFFTRNDGLQNQAVLYWSESLTGEPKVLLDPNKLSNDGTVALADWEVSDDGKLLAYGLAGAGSDWREWKVMEVDTGKVREDSVKWSKFAGIAWTPDNRGFFYARYDEPPPDAQYTGANYFQKLYYHKVGDPQSKDQLVYHRPDEKEWGWRPTVTEDGKYLVVSVWKGTQKKNLIFYKDLTKADAPMVELIKEFDAQFDFVGNDGERFYFTTDSDAPKRRLIAIDLAKPAADAWTTVIPESTFVLQGVNYYGGAFAANYLEDAQTAIRIYGKDGKPIREVKLPAIGTAVLVGGKQEDPETFYTFTNFTTPTRIYRYDIKTGESTLFREPKVKFNPDDYETKQVFATSYDGTKVPIFISHKKGLKIDGKTPTLLYAYGGFDISLTPNFNVSNLVWMERGGVYALANLRGGGEYGREWHEAGMKLNKQNVFDDFLSAAEHLIESGYTRPDKLAIEGGSNGGLLVGAAMTQRPDLFGAALPRVGVMDMLRFHKFTIGWAWVSEYGSSDNPEDFPNLRSYSPLHRLRKGVNYPATMVLTGDHDDRVVPGHSFKFAATLQYCQGANKPALIRIETSAGHGAGTPTSKLIDTAADVHAFLHSALQIE
jgi:prolyl oligopeptidase